MGAFDGKTTSDFAFSEETRSQSNFSMESGFGNMVDKFAGLGFNASSDDSLFQVIKAVEAAESTIRQQVEDNNNLRIQLQKRTEELERYKSDTSAAPGLQSDNLVDDQILGPYRDRRSVSHIENQADRFKWIAGASLLDPQHTLALEQNIISKNGEYTPQTHLESDQFSGQLMNGNMYMLRNGRSAVDNANSSHLSSTSSRSHSPSRYQIEGEYDPKFNSPQDRRITTPDINHQDTAWKQDLVVKFREHEEEILQLRKQLSDYSMKEAQLRNEKYVLEKRIAYMRMAFDQQQQDLVEAASKAISYRQDIIEENIRLTYALQAAQQERSTFISSLLPLLVEYSLQPSVPDAQSIVNNLKVLFKHLQEKLLVTEEKLKEFNYQLAPWRSDAWNHSSFTSQSPHRAIPTELNTSHKNRHELVPQSYSHREAPISHSIAQTPTTRDRMGDYTHHSSPINVAENNLEPENVGRSSPTLSRNAQDVSQGGSHAKHFTPKTMDEQLSFTNLVRSREMDDSYKVDYQNGGEPSTQWVSQNSPYINPAPDDPSPSFSPHLPPVMEETSSSFSEDVEEDPLPAVEGLQISGEAYPGRELQACGYSVNGTTSCNFEWVRYLEDGSVNYIEGAKQPTYLVTADDVDSYLAIEVQPLDNRKRKGELVKVFANDQRKITCDSEMQEQIEKTLYSGNASYEVSLAAGYMDFWEPAILAIKRQGYSIKCNGTRGVVVTEKFSQRTAVVIPYGHPTTFSIIGSGGMEHLLRTTDNSSFRDGIVLTMRLFIAKAVEKRKGKKRGLFFSK